MWIGGNRDQTANPLVSGHLALPWRLIVFDLLIGSFRDIQMCTVSYIFLTARSTLEILSVQCVYIYIYTYIYIYIYRKIFPTD